MDIKKEFTTVTVFSKIVAMMLVVALLFVGFYLGMQYGRTVEPAISPTPVPALIGGDTDDYGCLIGAGYSWCEEKISA
jgi:hypothetical protein